MEFIIITVIYIIIAIILKFVMTGKIKELKDFKKREDLDTISKKLPDNTTICKQILKMVQNEDVAIEEKGEYGANLYTIYNNKIIITNKNEEYASLQTIAHECIHSTQNKKLLWFHFILSNIYLLYYFILLTLTVVGIIKDPIFHLYIYTTIGFLHYIVRSHLETEAMIKAEYLSKEYLEMNTVLETQEKEELLKVYQKINKLGIPFINYITFLKLGIKIIVYAILCLLIYSNLFL